MHCRPALTPRMAKIRNIGARLTPAPTGLYNRSIAKLLES